MARKRSGYTKAGRAKGKAGLVQSLQASHSISKRRIYQSSGTTGAVSKNYDSKCLLWWCSGGFSRRVDAFSCTRRRAFMAFLAEMGIFLSISWRWRSFYLLVQFHFWLIVNSFPPVFRGRVLSLVGKADLYCIQGDERRLRSTKGKSRI